MTRLKIRPPRRRTAPAPAACRPDDLADVAPPKPRFFLGWGVLIVAALGMFASAPGQSFSVATFKEPMEEALSISDTSYSTAYLVATLISGACLPFIGRLTDRYGARLLLPIIAGALGASCWWMSTVQGFIGVFIGFCLIRPLGQGALTLVSTWLVGHWFEKRRGLAMGLLGLGGTLSVMAVPPISYYVANLYGWRVAWIVLGAIVTAILVLPAIIFVRNRPEDVGLLPDGRDPHAADGNDPQSTEADIPPAHVITGQTVEEAWREITFWKLLLPLCTSALVGTGLVFHQFSIFAERGMSGATAVTILFIQATMASLGALVFGYLSDRLAERRLLTLAMVMLGTAQLMLTSLDNTTLAAVYGMLLGAQGAIMRTAGTAVWVNVYGRLHQGAIRGIVLTFQVIASALGPLPFALAKDYWGSYSPANWMLLVLPLGSAIAVWTAQRPSEVTTLAEIPAVAEA